MKRITVTPVNPADTRRWAADLPDAQAQPWIDLQVATNGWGLPQRQVPDPNWTPGAGQTEADHPQITLPAEYTVNVLDIPDATYAQQLQDAKRLGAADMFDLENSAYGIMWRSLMVTLINEVNNLRQWLAALKTANNAAATYAALKTGINGLPNMPDRTVAQAKTALRNNATGGSGD